MLAKTFPVILACALLAACASGKSLPEAKGPYFPLNSGKWTPTAADVAAIKAAN